MSQLQLDRAIRNLERMQRLRNIIKWVIGAPLWLLVMLVVAVVMEFGCGIVAGGRH